MNASAECPENKDAGVYVCVCGGNVNGITIPKVQCGKKIIIVVVVVAVKSWRSELK